MTDRSGAGIHATKGSATNGLGGRRRGRPSPRRVPLAEVERGLALYRENYFDFNVRDSTRSSGRSMRRAQLHPGEMGAAREWGLVRKNRRRGVHGRRRLRRLVPGMLSHLDGSSHVWLGEGYTYDLLVVNVGGCPTVTYQKEHCPCPTAMERCLTAEDLRCTTSDPGERQYGKFRRRTRSQFVAKTSAARSR